MKRSIILFGLLMSSFVHAAGILYICNENGGAKRTVTLTQVNSKNSDNSPTITEGKEEPFTLRIFKEGKMKAYVIAEGHASREDVVVTFTSNDGHYDFGLYLDELNQNYLNIDGVESGLFTCKVSTK